MKNMYILITAEFESNRVYVLDLRALLCPLFVW